VSLYILEHANSKFVSGLFWQVLSRPREAKAEAKELGESMNFDFLLIRSAGSVMQAGFCARSDGATEGMTSIAALFSRAIESDNPPLNWIAVVALPNGDFAYSAVRDGAFLPDGDFAGSKEEVINRMTSDYGLGDWELVVCPEDFGFPNSQEKSFEDFLAMDSKGRYKAVPSTVIEPVKRQIPWKQISIVVGTILVLGVGGMAGLSYYEKLQTERQEAMVAEQKARMEAEAQAKARATPPWATLPDPMKMLASCEEEIFQLPIMPAGWDFEGALCNREGKVKAGFKRIENAGTIFDIKNEFGNKVRIDWGGDAAIHEYEIKFALAKNDQLLKADEVVEKLVGTAQSLDLKVAVKDAAKAGPIPGQAPPNMTGPVKFGLLYFEAKSNIKPSMYERVFSLPGIRPVNVKVTPSGEWTVEGEIYVEPTK
jgi:hypothetical protein